MSKDGIQPYECTREHLIELCHKSIVKKEFWHKDNSHEAQMNIVDIHGYLVAECDFSCTIHADDTIWIEFNNVTKQQYLKARSTPLEIDSYKNEDEALYTKGDNHIIYLGERENYSLTDDFGDDILKQYLLFYIPSEKRLKKCNGKDWF